MAFTRAELLDLKQRIAQDDIDRVLKTLLTATKNDSNYHNDVVMTANRFREHEHRRLLGTEPYTALNHERTGIVQALLHIIDNLMAAC